MDLRRRLTVLHDDGGAFTDYSADAQDFKRDAFSVTLTTGDYIYVGFHKDINALYAQVDTANVNPADLTIEYYTDQGVWTALEVSDDSRAFTRSGFITWQRVGDAANATVNSLDKRWVRLSVSADSSAMSFQALNILFSDDNDVSQEVPALIDACFYQSGQTSHVLHHVAAKNYIMGRLRSAGYVKYDSSNSEENINEWDVLDVYELRMASTYYAIAQIYFNLSDDIDDQYWIKYQDYIKRFEESFDLGRLRIDIDDNGEVNSDEKRPVYSQRWHR